MGDADFPAVGPRSKYASNQFRGQGMLKGIKGSTNKSKVWRRSSRSRFFNNDTDPGPFLGKFMKKSIKLLRLRTHLR